MKINWRQKLSSRKFWALLAILISSNLALFGVAESTVTQVTAIVTQFGGVIVYILVEGSIDREHKDSDKSGDA